MRTLIDRDPFIHLNKKGDEWRTHGHWPCFWIGCPNAGDPPFVTAYRLRFTLEVAAIIRIHLTADERYELYLDSQYIGRGSERGEPYHWFYETYDLPLSAGDHILVARVWSLGEQAAIAQMSVHPGFLCAAEGEWNVLLGTGVAAWEAKPLAGYTFLDPSPAHWRGAMVQIDGSRYPWGVESGAGDDWLPALKLHPGVGRLIDWEFYRQHVLTPASLPPMLYEPRAIGKVRYVAQPDSTATREIPVRAVAHLSADAERWTSFLRDQVAISIPPHTIRRILIDLENYYLAYPEITVSGGAGATLRLLWAEALYDGTNPWKAHKGNRDQIEGKYFIGIGDTFLPDGGTGRRFSTLWWEAGRYLELTIQTDAQPLTVHRLMLYETRYPLEMESRFDTSDTRLTQIVPLLLRGLQMTTNETYFDGPYYEELMYTGDARLECLLTYTLSRDDRLPRKAIQMFDYSRLASGFTQSRYPSRKPQLIPPFAIWWIAMVHDYALWRDDPAFVRQLLPGVRQTIQAFERAIGADGLLYAPDGWNTLDWVESWEAGIPPGTSGSVSGALNWQLVYGLGLAAKLESWFGTADLAVWLNRWADDLTERLITLFWDESRGLYADDLQKQHFSEHTQCMAILSGRAGETHHERIAAGLLNDSDLARASIYFSYYLFETYCELGSIDTLLSRLTLWFDLFKNGLKTPTESFEPSRSDCHSWSSHPLHHYFATILGIRPFAPGFHSVQIRPQLGTLTSASGTLVHPQGEIAVAFQVENGALHGLITLPSGVSGTLCLDGQRHDLIGGKSIQI